MLQRVVSKQMIKRICIFCGSNPGKNPKFIKTAIKVGTMLAENKIGVVYGGASVGMMGAVANAALAAKGEVIGVIPKVLAIKEIAHPSLSEIHIVKSMHERKALMSEFSHAYIALPGGFGTMEELFEVLTWAQLGIHFKPCAILNVDGYYDKLISFMKHAFKEGYVPKEHQKLILIDTTPQGLLKKIINYQAPTLPKWDEEI